MHTTPGIRYRERLIQALAAAGVDTSALLRAVEGKPALSTRLGANLNAMVFQIPGELARDGYPTEQIEAAQRVAERMVATAFTEISKLARELLADAPSQPAAPQKDEDPPLAACG